MGELISKKIKNVVSPYLLTMFMVIILGGQLGILKPEIFENTGFAGLTYSFGLPFVLISFGASISIERLKGEWKTVIIA